MTLPTPEQLVISGLKFFLRMHENVQIGQGLAPIVSPVDGIARYPDGICFYLKVNIWWHELPDYCQDKQQVYLVNTTEMLVDKLIQPYLNDTVYLPNIGTFTEERLRVAKEILTKLEVHQNATTSIP